MLIGHNLPTSASLYLLFNYYYYQPLGQQNPFHNQTDHQSLSASMVATATATIGSSFSPAKHTFRSYPSSTNNKLLSISEPLLVKFGYATKTPHSPLVSHSQLYYGTEPLSIGSLPHMWRAPLRLAAAMVASEEAVETGSTEEAEVEEESTQVEAENGDGDQIQGEVPAVNTKLYFGNLPYHCDSAQLAGIVQQYGTPELVEVLYDRDTGRSRGFAFVTMSCVEDCNAVIENLDGSEYGGRFLRVNFSDKPKKREPLYPETEHKLFVGNLSWSVTSESLYQAFQEYGNVVGARVLYDGETGKSRGYGFVCYSTRSEMENALASLNGVELEGRAIRVSLAEGKKS